MPIPNRELLGTKYVLLFLKCCAFEDYTEKKRDKIQTKIVLTGGSLVLEVYQDPLKYPIKEKRSLHSFQKTIPEALSAGLQMIQTPTGELKNQAKRINNNKHNFTEISRSTLN